MPVTGASGSKSNPGGKSGSSVGSSSGRSTGGPSGSRVTGAKLSGTASGSKAQTQKALASTTAFARAAAAAKRTGSGLSGTVYDKFTLPKQELALRALRPAELLRLSRVNRRPKRHSSRINKHAFPQTFNPQKNPNTIGGGRGRKPGTLGVDMGWQILGK